MTLHWSRRTGLATCPSRRSASLLPSCHGGERGGGERGGGGGGDGGGVDVGRVGYGPWTSVGCDEDGFQKIARLARFIHYRRLTAERLRDMLVLVIR